MAVQEDNHRSKRSRTSAPTISNNEIPPSPHYQVSYAHRSVITCMSYSSKHDMVITASQDGIIKFWKRTSVSSSASSPKVSNASSKKSNGDYCSSGQCVEFVKSYVSHIAPITALVMSQPDGDFAASVGEDNLIKFYDVGGFDVSGMIRVGEEYKCGRTAAFVGEEQSLLAVSSSAKKGATTGVLKPRVGDIFIFSSISLAPSPIKIIRLHAAPIVQMRYNYKHQCMISADRKGVIELWNGSVLSMSPSSTQTTSGIEPNDTAIQDYDAIDDVGNDEITNQDQQKINDAAFASLGNAPAPELNGVLFKSKLDTDLYSLLRKKTYAVSLAISPTGNHFAVYGSDRKVRLFNFKTGKSIVQYDERMKVYDSQVQKRQASIASGDDCRCRANGMDAIDYGNRAAREKEMSDTTVMNILSSDASLFQECGNQSLMLEFDPSGKYLILPTIIGIKVIEISTNRCRMVIGKGDASTLRFLGGCMCLGDAKIDKQMVLARTADMETALSKSRTGNQKEHKVSDSLFIAMAFNKKRFYVFSHIDPITKAEEGGDGVEQQEAVISRDILNEPPDVEDLFLTNMEGKENTESLLGREAILRTTMGDIHIRLFPDEAPRTVENFSKHTRNGYYDHVIFHRVIKGFMIQTGDPLGDGTGGESVWGGEFEDEFVRDLRHDRPFTVSMANAGPNTNGSQFFITTVPTPWLDNKHTVFGRVTRGMDICSSIEAVKVDELDKPLNDISIVSIDIVN